MIHATVDDMKRFREANPDANPGKVRSASTASELNYHGGVGGVGVETAPKIYLVLWGSQWNNGDPSGEESILSSFYSGVGSSSWLNSVTQYCQGVASGTEFCKGAGTAAGNQKGLLAGVWYDNTITAPKRPKQSQIAAEAVRAAPRRALAARPGRERELPRRRVPLEKGREVRDLDAPPRRLLSTRREASSSNCSVALIVRLRLVKGSLLRERQGTPDARHGVLIGR